MSLGYKKGSVIGGSLDPEVIKQLKVRTDIISKRTERTDQDLIYLNSTSGWVKLTSAINVDGSNNTAKSNILLGGTAMETGPRGGIFNNQNNAYDFSSTLGYRPMAGIVSFQATSKNTFGTLRQASVGIKVNSIEQLDTIEQLFFRPGMTALLEWGHSLSYDNTGNFNSIIKTYSDFFTPKSQEDIDAQLQALKLSNSYNYDVMYGFIKNFTWSYNLDGGYDCKVDIISKGELLESLQIQISPTATTSDNIEVDTESEEQYKTNLHAFLYTIKNTPAGSSNPIAEALRRKLPSIFSTLDTNLTNVGRSFIDGVIYLTLQGTVGSIDPDRTKLIKMSTFLELLNRCFVLKDKNGISIAEFNYGQTGYSTPYFTFPGHFALDPNIAAIPKQSSNISLRYNFQDQVRGGEDDILDIYINIDYIIRCYDSTVTSEELDEKTLIVFIKKVLNGITETFGYVNDFDIHYDEDIRKWFVVDRRVVPSNNDLSDSKIDLIGLNSQLENLTISSTLSSNITTMIAIGAQANNTDAGIDVLMLQKWNSGLTDRHLEFMSIGAPPPSDTVQSDVDLDIVRLLQFTQRVNSAGHKYYFRYDQEDIAGLVPTHKYTMNKLSENSTKSSKSNPGGIIPFKLSFTIKGISGLKIGQAFKIADESILPKNYRGNVAFIITGLNHILENSRWVVKVDSLMILSSTFTETVAELNLEQSSGAGAGSSGAGAGGNGAGSGGSNPGGVTLAGSNLAARGWTVQQPKVLTSVNQEETLKILNETTDNCNLKKFTLATMLQEQPGKNGALIAGVNNNFVGIDLVHGTGWTPKKVPGNNGYVVANEGTTKKPIALASFDTPEAGIASVVQIFKSRGWDSVSNAQEAGIKWLEKWNGLGIRRIYNSNTEEGRRLRSQYKTLNDYYNSASARFQEKYRRAEKLIKC